MWKTTSKGVTAKIRALPVVPLVNRNVATSSRLALQADRAQLQNTESMKEPIKTPPPPPKQPPKQKKSGGGGGKLLGLGLVAGTVGVVGYAWYSHDFRSQVSDTVPYSKDFFTALFTYLPDSPSIPAPILSERKRKADDQEPPKLRATKPAASSMPPPPPATAPAPKAAPEKQEQTKAASEAETAAQKKEREKQEALRRQKEREIQMAEENAALEVALENAMVTSAKVVGEARELVNKMIAATKAHADALKTAMDDSSKVLEKETQWQTVSMAFEAREEASKAANEVIESANANLEQLRKSIEDGRASDATKKNRLLITSKEKLNDLTKELSKKKAEVAKAESESRVMSKYKDLVNKGKEQFRKELESIMPEGKIGKGSKLSEEELNALIAHAHRRIDQLQQQLAEQIAREQQRIQEALEDQRQEDDKIARYRIDQERRNLKNDFSVEKEKWEAEAQVQFEIELRRQLARQTAAHSDHLRDVLEAQEKRLMQQFERELNIKMLTEREKFDKEVSGWTARVHGIEKALAARAESEKVAQQAQEMWLACVALNGVIRVGNENGKKWEDQLQPLEPEVNAVFEAGRKNPFVNLVLESIPEKALTRGVYTEDNLKSRFVKVRKVAKRVALIDETGGSLAKYFLSYVQSVFIFNTLSADCNVEVVDVNNLDPLQILDYASYWMAKGDLEKALRFMNQLRGEPRRVASDWIEEVRLHLEAKQAAQALMAFASATGLGTIF